MLLSSILENIEFSSNVNIEENGIDINEIVYDSRKAHENTIFVAIVGETVDGHKYVKNAYDLGTRVFVVSHDVELPEDAVQIKVENSRKSLSRMSHNFFSKPSESLKVVGVTGTKGKTTITSYLSHILNYSGLNTGVIGTNGIFYNGKTEKTINTTPESYELHKTFRKMLDDGVECVCIEASSGGMMMDRVDDIDFDIALFNNISPDHIGPKEHPTFENYLECKARLFKFSKYGIVNDDDKYADYVREYAKKVNCEMSGFAIHRDSDLKAENIRFYQDIKSLGVEFDCNDRLDGTKYDFYLPSPGEFSIYNALAVISICKRLGLSNSEIAAGMKDARVDGRVEVLPLLPDISIIIDYAHNGVSLENVLNTLKEYKPERLICLFGSVGGRTAIRRKELGDVAARLCDISIITTDNPDDEDPMNVINDIAKSFVNSDCEVYKEVDREKAIRFAVDMLKKGDMLILAGKGHEKYQYVNGERVFFDEKAIVTDAAKKRLERESASLK